MKTIKVTFNHYTVSIVHAVTGELLETFQASRQPKETVVAKQYMDKVRAVVPVLVKVEKVEETREIPLGVFMANSVVVQAAPVPEVAPDAFTEWVDDGAKTGKKKKG